MNTDRRERRGENGMSKEDTQFLVMLLLCLMALGVAIAALVVAAVAL